MERFLAACCEVFQFLYAKVVYSTIMIPLKRIRLTAIPALLISGCAFQIPFKNSTPNEYSIADATYDRAQFGNAPFPFWFNLKPVEIRTLQNDSQAKSENPDELLALALVASGDVRDSLSFKRDTAIVKAFVAGIRPVVAAERDVWHKGHALFEAMRKEFLKADPAADLAGYDVNQGAFSTLLETGKYNCVSSAMLYIVLARYFDLPASGVQLPSYTFVQLTAADNKIIEIETTAGNGFDWIHDENFYKAKALTWFLSRGLPRSTYEDYKKRQVVEPYRLVGFAMAKRHIDPAAMKFEDVNRLKEIAGYVLDDDAAAQKERFALYALECQYFQKTGDFKTAERMFKKIMPVVLAQKQRFAENADVRWGIAALEYGYATILLSVHKHEEFVAESKSALDEMAKSGMPDTSEMYKAVFENVSQYIKFYTDNMSDYADAESLATVFAPYARGQEWFLTNVQAMYGTQLKPAWDKKDWPEAVRILKKLKAVDPQGTNSAMIAKNLEAAYVNWSVSYSNEEEWAKAKNVLKQCVNDSASTSQCGEMLDELEKAHPQ